jgi:hypothetical protein
MQTRLGKNHHEIRLDCTVATVHRNEDYHAVQNYRPRKAPPQSIHHYILDICDKAKEKKVLKHSIHTHSRTGSPTGPLVWNMHIKRGPLVTAKADPSMSSRSYYTLVSICWMVQPWHMIVRVALNKSHSSQDYMTVFRGAMCGDKRPSSMSLIGLAMPKILISSIQFLGRHNGRHSEEMTKLRLRPQGSSGGVWRRILAKTLTTSSCWLEAIWQCGNEPLN